MIKHLKNNAEFGKKSEKKIEIGKKVIERNAYIYFTLV